MLLFFVSTIRSYFFSYYSASPVGKPFERHLYRTGSFVNVSVESPECLTCHLVTVSNQTETEVNLLLTKQVSLFQPNLTLVIDRSIGPTRCRYLPRVPYNDLKVNLQKNRLYWLHCRVVIGGISSSIKNKRIKTATGYRVCRLIESNENPRTEQWHSPETIRLSSSS